MQDGLRRPLWKGTFDTQSGRDPHAENRCSKTFPEVPTFKTDLDPATACSQAAETVLCLFSLSAQQEHLQTAGIMNRALLSPPSASLVLAVSTTDLLDVREGGRRLGIHAQGCNW